MIVIMELMNNYDDDDDNCRVRTTKQFNSMFLRLNSDVEYARFVQHLK